MKSRFFVILILSLSGGLVWAQIDPSPNAAPAYTGPPPSSNMSPDDAVAYFSKTLDDWLNQNPQIHLRDEDSDVELFDSGQKVRSFDVSQVGVDNLLFILGHQPRSGNDSELGEKGGVMWRQAALDNIQKLATDDDFSKIMEAAKQTPVLIEVMKIKGWVGRPEVDEFLKDQLVLLDQSHQYDSRGRSGNIFNLAAQSTKPAVNNKLADVMRDVSGTLSDEGTTNLYLFRCQLFKAILSTQNDRVKAAAPALLSAITHSKVLDSKFSWMEYPYDFAGELEDVLVSNPNMFIFQTSDGRHAMDDFCTLFVGQNTDGLDEKHEAGWAMKIYAGLALAMKTGNKNAFDQIASQIKNPTNGQGTNGKAITCLLDNTIYNGPGDKAQGVGDHTDVAVFDPTMCKWTITVPGYVPPVAGTTPNPASGTAVGLAATSSSTDLSQYVDKLIKDWGAIHPNSPPPSNGGRGDNDPMISQLSQELKGYDMNSLLVAYSQTVNEEWVKRKIMFGAIRAQANTANLPLLINTATGNDLFLNFLILGNKEWEQNTEVIQFASRKLDHINEFCGSGLPFLLIAFASRSHDETLRNKLLHMAQNSGYYKGPPLQALLDAALSVNDEQLIQNVPNILHAAISQLADPQQGGDDPTKIFPRMLIRILTEKLMKFPQLCANRSIQADVPILLKADQDLNQSTDILGASIGDTQDFNLVMGRLDNRLKGQKNVSGTGSNMDRPELIDLDNKFFATVLYNGAGNKSTGVMANLSAAKFDQSRGRWVVSAVGAPALRPLFPPVAISQPAPTPAHQSAARTANMASAASLAADATGTKTAPLATLPSPPILPDKPKLPTAAPRTGTIITATQISTRTPSGGYAAMPLDVGDKVTILSINADGTVTAINAVNFQGEMPQTAVSINKSSSP